MLFKTGGACNMTLKKVSVKPKLAPQKKKVSPKAVLNSRRSYCDDIHSELQGKGVDFFTPSESGGSLNINSDYLSLPYNITEVKADVSMCMPVRTCTRSYHTQKCQKQQRREKSTLTHR